MKTDKQKKNQTGQPNQPKESNQQLRTYAKYSGLAFQMIATILLGLWIGSKVDEWINSSVPIFTISGILLAIVGSLVALIKNLPKS